MDATPQTPPRLGRRPALDGMRAFAVLLVVGIHVGLLAAGYIGVDVFLPLSGFLITVLLHQEWDGFGAISLRRFFERRARRLLPALLVLLTGFAVVMLVLRPWPLEWPLSRLVATTVLFANNFVCTFVPSHGSALGALSPTWTLAQEAQFYLVWPPVLWLLLRRGTPPRVVLGGLALVIAALIAAGPLVAALDPHYNPYTSPLDRSAELLFGAFAALLWRERLVPGLLRRPITGWGLVAGLAALVVTARPGLTLWYLTAAGLSALLIVHLLSRGERSGVLERILALRPVAYTGRISYGIYLFHVPVYYLVWTYLRLSSPALYYPIVVALTIAAAAASWELVESPILRAGRGARSRVPAPPRAGRVPLLRRLAPRGSETG